MPEQRPDEADEVDLTPGAPVEAGQTLGAGERRALWWFLGIFLVVQAVGLFSPGEASVPEPMYVDKVIHATLLGVPVYLLGRLTGRTWLWAGVFAAYGAASEVIQWAFVPGRDGDIFDFTADVVGIAIALLALRWTRKA